MINKIKNNKLLMQICKFGIVGGMAFLIDYAILIFSKEILGFNVLISAALGFSISVIFNYIASVKWIFVVNQNNSKTRNFTLFIILSIIGLLITELIMYIGTDIFTFNYMIIKIIATIIVMIFNFITRKIFLEK